MWRPARSRVGEIAGAGIADFPEIFAASKGAVR
jgi:hypothetical protein